MVSVRARQAEPVKDGPFHGRENSADDISALLPDRDGWRFDSAVVRNRRSCAGEFAAGHSLRGVLEDTAYYWHRRSLALADAARVDQRRVDGCVFPVGRS